MIARPLEQAADGRDAAEVATHVRRIAHLLQARKVRVVDEIVDAMHLQLPAYWRYRDHALQSDLVTAVSDIMDIFVSHVRDGRLLWREEIAAIRGIAARRVRQRIPLPVLLEAVTVAEDVAWQHIVGCAEGVGSAQVALAAVGELGSLLHSFCRFTRETMEAAYAAGADGDVAVLQREILVDLFSGPETYDDAGLQDRARQAGVDLRAPHGILLVTAPPARGERNSVSRAVTALAQKHPGLIDVPTMSGGTPHATLVLPAPRHLWAALLEGVAHVAGEHGVVVLAMDPVRGARELRCTYRRASRLLRVAASTHDGSGVVVPRDLRVLNLLIDGVNDWPAFVDETIGPILRMGEDRRAVYLDTIRALATTRGGKAAMARAMDVHEKTVAHRVAKLRSLTGLDPDSPIDRMQLMLALSLITLGAGTS